MEVYYNGEWGFVCNDGWDLNNTKVVCTELGYGPAITATHPYHLTSGLGVSSKHTWLDEVNCVGTEMTIANCSHGEWRIHDYDCSNGEVAGVRCAGSSGMLFNCLS